MASSAQDNRGRRTVADSMKQMCLSEELADVTFVVGGSDTKVHAHRVILSMRSSVFKAMLYGPLSGNSDSEIQIKDVDLETFQIFLRFIYTDAIGLDGKNVLKILYLANKYKIEILEEKCCEFLYSSATMENVYSIHEQAEMFSQHELQRKCFDFIIEHASVVFQTKAFLGVSKEMLGRILASENLPVSEKGVFDAAVRWAQHQCKEKGVPVTAQHIRQQLGDDFYRIRFPLIPMDVFAKEISQNGFLPTEEDISLLRYMAIAPDGQGMVGKFIARPRRGKHFILTLNQQIGHPYLIQNYEQTNRTKIVLSSPCEIKLTSVVCREAVMSITHSYSKGPQGSKLSYRARSHSTDICFEDIGNTLIFQQALVFNTGFWHTLVFESQKVIPTHSYEREQSMKIGDHSIDVKHNTDMVKEIRISL